jgi:hypothetical protein
MAVLLLITSCLRVFSKLYLGARRGRVVRVRYPSLTSSLVWSLANHIALIAKSGVEPWYASVDSRVGYISHTEGNYVTCCGHPFSHTCIKTCRIPGEKTSHQIPPDTWPSYLCGVLPRPDCSESGPLFTRESNARALAWLVTSNLASKENTLSLSTLLCRWRHHANRSNSSLSWGKVRNLTEWRNTPSKHGWYKDEIGVIGPFKFVIVIYFLFISTCSPGIW